MQNLIKNFRVLFFLSLSFVAFELNAGVRLENHSGEFVKEIIRLKGMNDQQAYALCMDGDILYCGSGRYIYALDTSTNPTNPTVLSSVEIFGLVRQMTVQNGVLYATSRESGAWIIDVSNPKNIKLITRYDTVELATGVEVAGDVLFLGTRQNGVECVDVSDPANPVHIRMEKTHESQSVTYRNGILYSGEWRKHCVSVIDAKDMANLKTLKTVNLQGFGDGVWTYGNYLYVATGQHLGDESLPYEKRRGMGHGMEIFDISDPVNPKHISRIGFDFCHMSANDLWTPRPCSGGKYVAVADTYNGFYIVDAHNYENLSISTKLSFTREDNGKAVPVTSLAIGKGVIYISVFDGLGFYALVCPEVYPDVKEKGVPPTNANYRYDYSTSETSKFHAWRPESKAPVRGLAAKGSLLYAACSYGGLAILQQKKSGEVKLLGYGPMKFAGDVKVEGDILWVAEGFDGLAAYKIGRGAKIELIARYKDFFNDGSNVACQWVFTPTSNIIAAGPRTGKYYYLDVSNLPEIRCLGHVGYGPGWDKYPSNKADTKGWYPSVRNRAGIMWLDLNAEKLVQVKDDSIKPYLTAGICLFRNDTFLTCTEGSMYTFSSDKGSAKHIAKGGFNGIPVWDGADKVALTFRINRKITMVEYKEGGTPRILWSEDTSGYPETSIFWNGKLAVPCGYQGLLIEK